MNRAPSMCIQPTVRGSWVHELRNRNRIHRHRQLLRREAARQGLTASREALSRYSHAFAFRSAWLELVRRASRALVEVEVAAIGVVRVAKALQLGEVGVGHELRRATGQVGIAEIRAVGDGLEAAEMG